jgi:hypothetical protein
MDWLCGAWAALTGKARPPLSAAVLLADDRSGCGESEGHR